MLNSLYKSSHIAPLVSFRIILGAILFLGLIRFAWMGWIDELYIQPNYFFGYYGLEWIKPLPGMGMYLVFGIMALSFLGIAFGFYYRLSSISAFVLFTYVELIDKSNYLNHYYAVSIFLFLLIFIPAHRYFSIDAWRKPEISTSTTPQWTIGILKFQILIIYFFAGLAKINADWLLEAMPLKIWLPSKSDIAIFGPLLSEEWLAYLFSWFGMIYDLSIPFLLLYKKTRKIAFAFVLIFHLSTWILFPIGMFPFIMIGISTLFFSIEYHQRFIHFFQKLLNPLVKIKPIIPQNSFPLKGQKTKLAILGLFFMIQLILPLRYLSYAGDLFWTEQGYRFSWRVMLMEKAGYVIFHVKDPETGRKWEVNNYDFLCKNQEKMMSTQADMILQFAHHLDEHYQSQGIKNPEIRAEAYVSLNGSISQLYLDPKVDLTEVQESFSQKDWILPSPKNRAF